MKSSTKPVADETPAEPLPPPASNSDIRPWIHVGEAGDISLSGIEHNMAKAQAELGVATLKAREKIEAAHDALGDVLNIIKLWRARPAKLPRNRPAA